MAHGILEDDRMFSVGETPWHSHENCQVVEGMDNIDEVLEALKLRYKVTTYPMFVEMDVEEPVNADEPDGDTVTRRKMVQVPMKRAAIRTDNQRILGTVGNRYTHLQNDEAFQVLQPLVDQGLARLETGGTLHGGTDAWLLVKFFIDHPTVQEVFTDELIPFGLISNNHVGDRPVVLQNTPIRVVCANTLGAALGSKENYVKVRHTATVAIRTVEAARLMWNDLVAKNVALAEQYQELKAKEIDEKMFRDLVASVVAPLPKELEKPGLTKRQETSRTRIVAAHDELFRLWTEGKGHTGDHSAWEAYQAVAEFTDHNADFIKFRGDAEVQAERKQEALIRGRLFEVKGAVMRNLLLAK